MEEHEGVLCLREAVLTHEPLESRVSEGEKFSFECAAPRDPVHFLFLHVLTWHVGGVVEQRDVPLHRLVAELTCWYTVFSRNTLLDQARRAKRLTCRNVE